MRVRRLGIIEAPATTPTITPENKRKLAALASQTARLVTMPELRRERAKGPGVWTFWKARARRKVFGFIRRQRLGPWSGR